MKRCLLPLLLIGCALIGAIKADAQSNYEPYGMTTLAGLAGSPGSAGGTGSAARFNFPSGVEVDDAGNVYVADTFNHTIRKVSAGGAVSTLAGLAGSPGSADGSSARFNNPFDVAVDSGGNVYVADFANHTIRKITSGGVVSTLAGLAGNSGSANGTGSAARFNFPSGVAVDSAGNVYVADSGNHTIRKITPIGEVTTLAGLAGSSGSADGTGSDARFNQPIGVAVDGSGNVYVADTFNDTVRKITSGGMVSTLAGLAGAAGSADGTGSAARFNQPSAVAAVGSLVYVADQQNHTIRRINSAGVVRTLAGSAGNSGSNDGAGSAARFNTPSGVAVDRANNFIYVGDRFNHTIRVGVRALIFLSPATGVIEISTRMSVGTGDNRLIGGFIITGTGTTRALIRAIGPSLAQGGISNALLDPTLELRDGAGSLVRSNDNWRSDQESEIIDTSIPPSDDRESAIVTFLDPGSYTAIVSGKDNTTGIAVVEVYDLGIAASDPPPDAKLANISTRGFVDTGQNVMIGGFINRPGGSATSTRVVIRAIGPSLTQAGIVNALADPMLELRDSNGALLVANNNWQDDPAQAAELTAAGLAPTNQLESGVAAMLPQGSYTAIVSGNANTVGVAIVEIYALQ